jgi:hypothetical protein
LDLLQQCATLQPDTNEQLYGLIIGLDVSVGRFTIQTTKVENPDTLDPPKNTAFEEMRNRLENKAIISLFAILAIRQKTPFSAT